MENVLTPIGVENKCVINTHGFKTGDFVTARINYFPVLLHRGIVVVEDNCISIYHNTPTRRNAIGGNVVKENIQDWLKTRTITSITPTNRSKGEIEKIFLANSKRRFNVFTFNCEQLAFYVKDGRSRSPQLVNWIIFSIILIGGYQAFKK